MSRGSGGIVLVVDDEPAIRVLLRVNLELDGYDVLEAGTLEEARGRLADGPVDVVLLDLHLAGRTSHELIAECRERRPPVPVAVVTGSADPSTAERAGADAVIAKPFELEPLLDTVRALATRVESGQLGSGR